MHTNWLLPDDLGLPGRLGLTHGPGCFGLSRDDDLAILRGHGADLLVCLQEAEELLRLDPPETIAQRSLAVAAQTIDFVHLPIEDLAAPTLDEAEALVRTVLERLERGETVVLHCHSGLGRAGTLAACVLVRRGYSASGALALVRFVRPGAVQSDAQERLIQAFAATTFHTPPAR